MNRSLQIVSLVVFSTYVGGCNHAPAQHTLPVPGVPVAARSPKPIKDVYSVEDLVANPQDFAHTIVKVSGCFWSDIGSVFDNAESLLRQCGRAWSTLSDMYDHAIAVDDAAAYKINRLKLARDYPVESRSLLEGFPILLFDYNKKRNSQAWQKLLKGRSLTDYGSEVVLLGQFETNYIHVSATSNGLLLVDVLSIKAPTTR